MRPVTGAKSIVLAIAHTFIYMRYIRQHCDRPSPHLKHICGYIPSPWMSPKTTTERAWSIQVIKGYITNIMYHRFEMIYSSECKIASLQVTKYFTECAHQEVYCGHLPPWHEICPCQSVLITIKRHFLHTTTVINLHYFTSRSEKQSVVVTTQILQQESVIPLSTGGSKHIKQEIYFFIYADHKALIHVNGYDKMASGIHNIRGKHHHIRDKHHHIKGKQDCQLIILPCTGHC